MKKLGVTVFKGNKFTQHGQLMESAALERYEVETGHTVESFGLLVSEKEPWLGGSPDGITSCGRLIEVKCPYFRKKDGVYTSGSGRSQLSTIFIF